MIGDCMIEWMGHNNQGPRFYFRMHQRSSQKKKKKKKWFWIKYASTNHFKEKEKTWFWFKDAPKIQPKEEEKIMMVLRQRCTKQPAKRRRKLKNFNLPTVERQNWYNTYIRILWIMKVDWIEFGTELHFPLNCQMTMIYSLCFAPNFWFHFHKSCRVGANSGAELHFKSCGRVKNAVLQNFF